MAIKKWWITGKNITAQVNTDEKDIITFAPPVLRAFNGQPLKNLERWLKAKAVPLEKSGE